MAWYQNTIQQNPSQIYLTYTSIQQFISNQSIIQDINNKTKPDLIDLIINNVKYHRQLLEYITILPNNDDNDDRKYKYPMVSCQILENNEDLIRKILCEQNLIRQVYLNFLSNEDNLNSILPSYFSRIFEMLTVCKNYEIFIRYVGKNEIKRLIEMSQNLCIVKCLKYLIIVDQKYSYQKIQCWSTYQTNIIQQIFKHLYIHTSNQFLVQNLLQLLIQIIQKNSIIYNKKQILHSILTNPQIQFLFTLINHHSSYSIVSAKFIQQIFINIHKIHQLQYISPYTQFIIIFANHIPQLISLLNQPNLKSLQILQIIHSSLKIKKTQFQSIYLENKLFQKMFKLFFTYPQANILQSKIQKIISIMIEQQTLQLINYMFDDFDIIKKTAFFRYQDKNLLPYFGYLVKMAKSYTKFKKQTPQISVGINRNKDIWTRFFSETLQPYVKTIQKQLGSYDIKELVINNYTISSTCKNEHIPSNKITDIMKIQEQIPTSRITLDIIQDNNENNYNVDNKHQNQQIKIQFQNQKINDVVQQQIILKKQQIKQTQIQKKYQTPRPQLAEKSSNLTFQQFMNKRKGQISTSIQRSKTPDKKIKQISSSKKKNRWDSNEKLKLQVKIPANVPKSDKKGKKQQKQKGFLPKIKLFKVQRKMMSRTGQLKTRMISDEKDFNLVTILNWVKKQKNAIQIKNI